ncbi:MAG: 4Fe-4S binding protein [Eubacteriales bacterium]|nr:4Fe-4S binding protein [Eubacteriales bacterium]
MPDLSVTYGSLECRNPFVVASASTSRTVQQIKTAEEVGAGAVILKAIVTKHPYEAKPFYYNDPQKQFLTNPSDPRLLVDEGVELIKACKKESGLPIIANTMGSGGNLESWGDISKTLEAAGADMIEINLGCPNIGLMQKALGNIKGDEDQVLGAICGQSPLVAAGIVKTVRQAVKVPIMVKMTPSASDMTAVAEACMKEGADCVDISNVPQILPGVDIYHDGRPLYANYVTAPFSGLCGPANKVFTLRNIAQLSMKRKDAEIVGSGGLMDWEDCVEAILCGAKATALCTAIYWHGWDIFNTLNKRLHQYMEEMGYQTTEDFRGHALKYIATHETCEFRYVVPELDKSKCKKCGICAKPGHCDAIEMVDGYPSITIEKCMGCSLCASLCPAKALKLVPNPLPPSRVPTH